MKQMIPVAAALAIIATPAIAKKVHVSGPQPTWEEFQPKAEAYVRGNMLDPDFAKFKWDSNLLMPMKWHDGWVACGDVNGKNTYRGYTGYQPFAVFWNNGKVTGYQIAERSGSITVITNECIPPQNRR